MCNERGVLKNTGLYTSGGDETVGPQAINHRTFVEGYTAKTVAKGGLQHGMPQGTSRAAPVTRNGLEA